MKKLLLTLMLLAAALLVGCGQVHTYEERERRYRNIAQIHSRMLVDDWDYFWLADRPTYLSYWYGRQVD